jgi:type II secretory pathway pseudopilin PulG
MNSMKCPQCGLVNWSTAEACKRCRLPINGASAAAAGGNHWEGHAQGGYQDNSYASQGEQAGYGGAGYGESGYADNGYADNGYSQSGYAQNGYGQNGYSQNGYAQNGSDQSGYDQSNYYQGGYRQGGSYGYAGQGNYGGYIAESPKTGIALASMIIGIISMMACGLLGLGSVLGLILGIVALVKAKNSPMEYGGQGFAITGVALSLVSFVFVGIVFAIAIPNVFAARRAANEGSAIQALRIINSAEATFQATSGAGKYGTLQELSAQGLIDSKLASGTVNTFRIDIKPNSMYYEATATPTKGSDTGSRSFFINESGVIRGATKGGMSATAFDPPVNLEKSPNSYPGADYERPNRQTEYRPSY